MTGYNNYHLLSSARSLGRARTQESAFAMSASLCPFVWRVDCSGVYIAGEVFAVSDAATLARIDALEGHPDWCDISLPSVFFCNTLRRYTRTPVVVVLEASNSALHAQIYLNRNTTAPPVPSGDFRDVVPPSFRLKNVLDSPPEAQRLRPPAHAPSDSVGAAADKCYGPCPAPPTPSRSRP
jgi:gamma-glutamylcyclotransferase (GGCT)/AIG2-like uncharacterized protein YtfP